MPWHQGGFVCLQVRILRFRNAWCENRLVLKCALHRACVPNVHSSYAIRALICAPLHALSLLKRMCGLAPLLQQNVYKMYRVSGVNKGFVPQHVGVLTTLCQYGIGDLVLCSCYGMFCCP